MYKICIYNYDEVALNSQSNMVLDSTEYEESEQWRSGLIAPPEWVSDNSSSMLEQFSDGSGGNSTPYLGGINTYVYNIAPAEYKSDKISYLLAPAEEKKVNIAPAEYLDYNTGTIKVDYSDGSAGLLFNEDHGLCIHDDETITSFDKVTEPDLKLTDSAAGTLEFTLPLDNIGYGKLKRMITIVSVFQNGKEIFSGRVLSEEDDFWGRQKICVEGELSYLNDTTQPPAIINGTPREYVQTLLDRHNEKVRSTAPFKQFQLGVVIVNYEKLTEKYGDANEWTTNFESTLELLNKFVNDLEGHMEVIKSGGVRTLNIYDDWPRTSNQTISFGNNLLDFTQKYDMSELATVLIPLGKLEDQLAKGAEVVFNLNSDGTVGQRNKVAVQPKDGFTIYEASHFGTRLYRVFEDPTLVQNCNSLKFTYSSSLPSGFIDYAVFDAYGNCMTTTTSNGENKVNVEVSIQNTARYVFVSSYYDYTTGRGIEPVLNLVEGQTYSEEYWTYEELTRDEIVNPNTNPPTTANVVYDRKPVKDNRDVAIWMNLTIDQHWGYLIREHNLINDYGGVDVYLGLRRVDGIYTTFGPIPVEEGKRFYYSARCDEKFFMYAFVNSEGKLLDSKLGQECFDETQHNDVEDELVTAPKGAANLYFTSVSDRFFLWEYNELYDKLDKSLTVETAVVNEATGEQYGSYYVINENAVRNFGWIEKIVKFDDVTDATDLLRKARIYLESEQFDQLEINISALDLAGMGVNVDSLHLLDSVRCISEPHGLNKYYPIREIDLPLDKPDGAKYTLGEDLKLTLTDTSWDANADLQAKIEAIPSRESVLIEAKKQATAVMHQQTRGYVTFADTDQYGSCIYISDCEDYTQARRLWLWNLNGLGYSKDGGETFDLAITMDGAIVADFITAGTMSADRVRTGKIIDVNGYNWWDLSNGELVIGHNHAWIETRGLDENGNLTTLKRESLEEYTVNQYKIFKELFGLPDNENEVKRRVNGIRGIMTKISDKEDLYEYQLYISASQISSGVLMSDTDSFFFDLHNGTMVSTAQYRGFSNNNGTVTESGPVFDKFLQFLYCSVLGYTGGSYQPTTFDPYTGEVIKMGGIVGYVDPSSGESSSAELNGALDLAQTYPDGKHVTLSSKNSIIMSYGDTFYVEKGDVVVGEIEYNEDGDKRDGYVVNSTPRQFIFGETELFDGDGTKFQFDVDVRLNNSVVIGYDKNEYENPLPDVYIPISSGSLEVRGNTTLGRASAVYETRELRTLKKKKQAYNPQTGNTEYIYSTVEDPDNPGQVKKEYVYEYYDKPYMQKHYLDKVQINGDVNVTGTIKTSSIEIDDTISLNHVIAKKCIKVGQDYASGFFDDCVWETDSEMLEIQGYDSSTANRKANSTNVFCGANLFYDTAAFYGSGNSESAITGYGIIEYLLGPHKLNTSKDYDSLSTKNDVALLESMYNTVNEPDIQALVGSDNPATAIKKYRLVVEGGILNIGDSKFFGGLDVAMSPNHTFSVFGVPGDYTNIMSDGDIMGLNTTLVNGKAKVIYLSINQTYSGYGIYDILLNGFVKITCKLTLDAPLEVNKRADFNGSLYANGLSFFDKEAEFHDGISIVKVTGSGDQQTIEDIITLNRDSDRSIKVKAKDATALISIGYTSGSTEKYFKAYANGNLETTGYAKIGGDISGTGNFKLTKEVSGTPNETIVIANSGSITITDLDASSTDDTSEFILLQNSTGAKYVKLLSNGIVRATGSGLFEGSVRSGASIYIEQKDTDHHKSFNVSNAGSVTVTSYNEATATDTIQTIKIQNKSANKYVILGADGTIEATGAGKFGGNVTGSMLRVLKTGTSENYTFKVTNSGSLTITDTDSSISDSESESILIRNNSGDKYVKLLSNGIIETTGAGHFGGIVTGSMLRVLKTGTSQTYTFKVTNAGEITGKTLTLNNGSFTIYKENGVTVGFNIGPDGDLVANSAVIKGTISTKNTSNETLFSADNGGNVSARSVTISGGSLSIYGNNTENAYITYLGAASFKSLLVNGKTPVFLGTYSPTIYTSFDDSLNLGAGVINAKHLYVNGTRRIDSDGAASFASLTVNGTAVSLDGHNHDDRYLTPSALSTYAQTSWVISDFVPYTDYHSGVYNSINLSGNLNCLNLYVNGTMRIDSYGNGYLNSDVKLKHDIKPFKKKSVDIVNNIQVKTFKWKSNNKQVLAGFIAQDIEKINELYGDETNITSYVRTDEDGNKSIMYTGLIPILWKAVQELSQELHDLKETLK